MEERGLKQKIILKCILKNQYSVTLARFVWLWKGISGRVVWIAVMDIRVPYKQSPSKYDIKKPKICYVKK
jgi:hypothetical protein